MAKARHNEVASRFRDRLLRYLRSYDRLNGSSDGPTLAIYHPHGNHGTNRNVYLLYMGIPNRLPTIFRSLPGKGNLFFVPGGYVFALQLIYLHV
ncbi:hypothetical protein D3C85_1620530 [compost metagenome]